MFFLKKNSLEFVPNIEFNSIHATVILYLLGKKW